MIRTADRLDIERITARYENEPLALKLEPEPERCRCCRIELVVYEGRCLNCGALVLRKAA